MCDSSSKNRRISIFEVDLTTMNTDDIVLSLLLNLLANLMFEYFKTPADSTPDSRFRRQQLLMRLVALFPLVNTLYGLSLKTSKNEKEDEEVLDYLEPFKEVVRVVVKQYAIPRLTVARVAKELSVTPDQLSQFLNGSVGVNFTDLLRHIRIQASRDLLDLPDISVANVAKLVGYTDSNAFSRAFKAHEGMTPSEYRARATSGTDTDKRKISMKFPNTTDTFIHKNCGGEIVGSDPSGENYSLDAKCLKCGKVGVATGIKAEGEEIYITAFYSDIPNVPEEE
jgi:AraC-like DNA-binding protein